VSNDAGRRHTGIVLALLVLFVVTPWLAAIVYYWRRRPRDGFVPPSLADLNRSRLWTSR
jgi:hypothetical protein